MTVDEKTYMIEMGGDLSDIIVLHYYYVVLALCIRLHPERAHLVPLHSTCLVANSALGIVAIPDQNYGTKWYRTLHSSVQAESEMIVDVEHFLSSSVIAVLIRNIVAAHCLIVGAGIGRLVAVWVRGTGAGGCGVVATEYC